MKTLKINIANLLLITVFLLISVSGYSQNDKKLSRQEKKDLRKAELAANYEALSAMLETRSFVIEADYLENQYGEKVPVSPNINFVMVNRSDGVLQTGSVFGIGYNGVGGVTAEGNIGRYELNRNNKNLNYGLKFNILTSMGAYDIYMTVNSDFYARATISGTTSGKLIYTGRLEPLSKSKVYKGQRNP